MNSPSFNASYASYRKGRIPTERQYALSIEDQVKRSLRDRPRTERVCPGLVKELTDVVSIAASPWASAAVLASGRIMTWSEVRPWSRPGFNGQSNLSPFPILMWLDGLEQP